MKLTARIDGETYEIRPQESRDGKKRLCGSMWCHFCRCQLRTIEGRGPGYIHKAGAEWQGLVRCPEPCKRIREKLKHLCELKEVYFVKEGAEG